MAHVSAIYVAFYMYIEITLPVHAGFGLASHLGVLADIPCVGVGKKLYHVDGLQKGPEHKQKVYK